VIDPVADAVARLDTALAGRLCVSAWLGYGQVVFAGFGKQPLPERGADGHRPKPPFELQTNFADWSVTGPHGAVSSDMARGEMEAAAKSLIGQRVVGWDFLERRGLSVAFLGGIALRVSPWPASDEDVSDAWSLECSDGQILAVSTAGQVVVVNAKVPVAHWFGPAV
jgi:hypothetical protein